MNRITSLLIVCVLSVCTALQAAETNKPNILFLFTDDQRADTVGAWGNPLVKTPNIDRLAGEGLSFKRAYCMGAQQGAVCVPSRAMLMSGHSLFRVKENLQGITTFPEAFAEAGYRTFMTGKWHNGPASVTRSFQQGKAIFLGGMGQPYKLQVQDLVAGDGGRQLVNKRISGKHSCELFADSAVEFLAAQKDAKQPFLCYVAFNLPHDPRVAPQPFHDESNKAKPPVPANYLPVHPFNNGELVIRDERLAPWPRTEEEVRQHLADYYAAMAFVDQQIGRIVTALRESGQYDNTIIVYSSDHGLAIGSHGLMGKQNLYDHSMRSPLIFVGPGVPKGKSTEAMCYLLDIYPTLAAMTGIKGPAAPDAVPLTNVIAGNSTTARPAIFTAYRDVQRAVRDDRWKLIAYPKINKIQVFDLQADPHETKDLSTQISEGDLKRLRTLLESQQQAFGDKAPLTSPNPQPAEFDFSKVKPAPAAKE